LMYADDGFCEAFTEQSDCEAAETTGGLFNACVWQENNGSCQFEEPEIDFITTIIITLIVTMLAVPFDKVVEYNILLWVQYFHYRKLESQVGTEADHQGSLVRRYDEFAASQTIVATVLRAARLEKARCELDEVSLEDEVKLVDNRAETFRESVRLSQKGSFERVAAEAQLTQFGQQLSASKQSVTKLIRNARDEADTMKQEMDAMYSHADQEDYLMRNFIVHSFHSYKRSVVSRYFLKDYNLKRTDFVKFQEKASFVFLPLYLAALIWFVYVFNLSIGSRATNLWLTVTFASLGQDIILLQPTKIYINFVVINGSVSRHVRAICERLSYHSRLIMMRSHGMMRDAGALLQHFNPACRAARMYPHLPIARLLLSLNDNDLPQHKLPNPYLLPLTYFSAGLFAIAYLPEILQETIIDVSSGAILDFGIIGLFEFGKVSPAAVSVVVGIAVIVFIVREVRVYGQYRKERFSVLAKRRAAEEQQREKEQAVGIDADDIQLFHAASGDDGEGDGEAGPERREALQLEPPSSPSILRMEQGVMGSGGGGPAALREGDAGTLTKNRHHKEIPKYVDADEYATAEQEEKGSVWATRRSGSLEHGPFSPTKFLHLKPPGGGRVEKGFFFESARGDAAYKGGAAGGAGEIDGVLQSEKEEAVGKKEGDKEEGVDKFNVGVTAIRAFSPPPRALRRMTSAELEDFDPADDFVIPPLSHVQNEVEDSSSGGEDSDDGGGGLGDLENRASSRVDAMGSSGIYAANGGEKPMSMHSFGSYNSEISAAAATAAARAQSAATAGTPNRTAADSAAAVAAVSTPGSTGSQKVDEAIRRSIEKQAQREDEEGEGEDDDDDEPVDPPFFPMSPTSPGT